MKRKIVIGVLILIVVAGSVVYYLYSKKVQNYAEGEPDFSLSAKELIEAFNQDTASAGRKFADKKIRVIGFVKKLDSSAIVLGEEGSVSDVVIGLDDRNLKDIKNMKVGATAILQGKYTGYSKLSGNSEDLIENLGGTTVNIDYAGIINKK